MSEVVHDQDQIDNKSSIEQTANFSCHLTTKGPHAVRYRSTGR